MTFIKSVLFVMQLFSAVSVVVLVLLQNGKGAESGFASIGSDSLFGAKGSANFLSRATAISVTIFFIATIAIVSIDTRWNSGSNSLGVMSSVSSANSSVIQSVSKSNGSSVVPAVANSSQVVVNSTHNIKKNIPN
jgi:preprotein translocase subunit SecG